MFRFLQVLLAFIILAIVAACQSTPSPAALVTPTRTPAAPIATPQTLTPTAVPDTAITLTLWLPTRFLPATDNTAYQVLQRQLNDFAGTADGMPAHIIVKQDRGPGGLLDLLRAASPVAPAVLPDIIALDNVDLEAAARSGLVQPAGPLLPAGLIDDLYPFAHDLGSFNGQLYGVLYGTDLEHLATASTTPLPPNWSDLLKSSQRYLFTFSNNTGVSDAVLAHYFSAGGRLTDEQGNPTLDELALRTLLETYLSARDAGVLPGNFVEVDSAETVWNAWRGVGTSIADLNATRYLSVEKQLPDLQVGDLPTLIQPARSLGRGWAYAIVSTDARRQMAAARLIQYLLSPQNSGEWTRAAGVLPSRAAALAQWDQSDPYTTFIADQLARAYALPSAMIRNTVGPALRKAIEDVLAGRATPADAARAAVATVNPAKK